VAQAAQRAVSGQASARSRCRPNIGWPIFDRNTSDDTTAKQLCWISGRDLFTRDDNVAEWIKIADKLSQLATGGRGHKGGVRAAAREGELIETMLTER
jgi:hypothetical protein